MGVLDNNIIGNLYSLDNKYISIEMISGKGALIAITIAVAVSYKFIY